MFGTESRTRLSIPNIYHARLQSSLANSVISHLSSAIAQFIFRLLSIFWRNEVNLSTTRVTLKHIILIEPHMSVRAFNAYRTSCELRSVKGKFGSWRRARLYEPQLCKIAKFACELGDLALSKRHGQSSFEIPSIIWRNEVHLLMTRVDRSTTLNNSY